MFTEVCFTWSIRFTRNVHIFPLSSCLRTLFPTPLHTVTLRAPSLTHARPALLSKSYSPSLTLPSARSFLKIPAHVHQIMIITTKIKSFAVCLQMVVHNESDHFFFFLVKTSAEVEKPKIA